MFVLTSATIDIKMIDSSSTNNHMMTKKLNKTGSHVID